MQVFSPLMSRSNSRLVRVLALVLPMVVLLTGLLSQPARAENTFVITDGLDVTVYTGDASDPAKVLDEAGIALGSEDFYVRVERGGVSEIVVNRLQNVTIDNCGELIQVTTYGETVARLLERLDIAHTEEYALDVGLDARTYDGMRIVISSMITRQQTYAKELGYQVTYRNDPKLPVGTEFVLQEGVRGEALCTAMVTYENGVEIDRKDVNTRIIAKPQHQIIVRGTGEDVQQDYPIIGDGYIILQTGEVLTYTHSDIFMATAYTSWIEDVVDMTATGTHARHGAVAVDPKVIPYGTRMFIVTTSGEYVYGIATAEDCGGGVKGKHIDLFFETLEECNFGRQDIVVYFLGKADWRGRQYRTGIGFIE